MKTSFKLGMSVLAYGVLSVPALADVITNGLATTTVGYFAVDVTAGGQSRDGRVTATNASTNTVVTNTDVIFDYFTYVQYGGTVVQLTGAITSSNANTVVSTGTLGGGNVLWTATSTLPTNGTRMVTTFDFSLAATAPTTASLTGLRLFQYLDEDVNGAPGDDVFFTRGTVAAGNLELFTLDSVGLFGISHAGAYNTAQGLVNSSFAGWALCNYDGMRSSILAGTQAVSATGSRASGCNTGTTTITALGGTVDGPYDIVSVLAWDAAVGSRTSRIITSLGGIPNLAAVNPPPPPPTGTPEPASLVLLGLGVAGLGFARRRKR